MTDHAISRLIAKRAEIAGMIAELEEELNQCRADLTHIDGALRLLNADLDPTAIPPRQRRYKQTHYFGHNGCRGSAWRRCGLLPGSRSRPKRSH